VRVDAAYCAVVNFSAELESIQVLFTIVSGAVYEPHPIGKTRFRRIDQVVRFPVFSDLDGQANIPTRLIRKKSLKIKETKGKLTI